MSGKAKAPAIHSWRVETYGPQSFALPLPAMASPGGRPWAPRSPIRPLRLGRLSLLEFEGRALLAALPTCPLGGTPVQPGLLPAPRRKGPMRL